MVVRSIRTDEYPTGILTLKGILRYIGILETKLVMKTTYFLFMYINEKLWYWTGFIQQFIQNCQKVKILPKVGYKPSIFNVYFYLLDDLWRSKTYDLWLGLCKLGNEILKKGLEKAWKGLGRGFFRTKVSFLKVLACTTLLMTNDGQRWRFVSYHEAFLNDELAMIQYLCHLDAIKHLYDNTAYDL